MVVTSAVSVKSSRPSAASSPAKSPARASRAARPSVTCGRNARASVGNPSGAISCSTRCCSNSSPGSGAIPAHTTRSRRKSGNTPNPPTASGRARALPLAVGGSGVFPDFRLLRVVCAGIAPEPGLELLQHRVEQEIAPLGFPTEARAFRPHVTLGRAARDARAGDFAGLEAALGRLDFTETALVTTIDLMQSTLQSTGAVYKVRHSERLP